MVPPIFVVGMVASHQPPKEAELETRIELTVKLHRPRKEEENPHLLPCLDVENPTSEKWRNIAVSLNKQFYYYHPKELKQGEVLSVPLEFFVTKGGNVAFQPGSETVTQVTVYAQIPSGARAVSETYLSEKGETLPQPKP
jgi:hypothetical protein